MKKNLGQVFTLVITEYGKTKMVIEEEQCVSLSLYGINGFSGFHHK